MSLEQMQLSSREGERKGREGQLFVFEREDASRPPDDWCPRCLGSKRDELTIDVLNEDDAVRRSERESRLKSSVREAGGREVERVDIESKLRRNSSDKGGLS